MASLLDHLSGVDLALLRRENRLSFLDGTALFRCPSCLEPVYPATRSVAEAGTVTGARAYFKHHAQKHGTARDCALARERGTDPRAIDALRFAGQPEGAWHHAAKEAIADLCLTDPAVSAVLVETRIYEGADWRQPDLLLLHAGGTVAVEVQGASPQLDVVLCREAFYARAAVGLLWVLNADCPGDLWRQGFQDIYFPRDGVVFGWSRAAEVASRGAGSLRLHRLAVTEVDDAFDVQDTWVPLSSAVAEVMARVPARGALAEDPLARAYRAALLEGDEVAERDAFGRLRREFGCGGTWAEAQDDRLDRAVGAAVTALTGRKGHASGFADDAGAAILNSVLDARTARPWVPLVLRACGAHAGARERLARPSTARKIEAALAGIAAAPERADQLTERWSPIFARLFPLSRTPSEAPATVASFRDHS